jgi:hypothetical protein
MSGAEQYWGELVTPSQGGSTMFSRLLHAIVNHVRINDPSDLLEFSNEEEQLLMTPKMVIDMLNLLDIDYLPHDLLLFMPQEIVDQCFEAQYEALYVEFVEPAFLTYNGLRQWLSSLLLADPDHWFQALNKVLGNEAVLLDPATGRPFEFNSIPRDCFPKEKDPEIAKMWASCSELATDKIAEIWNEHKAAEDHQRAQMAQAKQLRQQREHAEQQHQQRLVAPQLDLQSTLQQFNEALYILQLEGEYEYDGYCTRKKITRARAEELARQRVQEESQPQGSAEFRQALQAERQRLRNAQEHAFRMLGGWEYDEYGRRKQVEGMMDITAKANF